MKNTADETQPAIEADAALLDRRWTAVLAGYTAALGLVFAWVAGSLPAFVPGSGSFVLAQVPGAVCSAAVLFALLAVPLAQEPGSTGTAPGARRGIFGALWMGAALLFFLALAGRLVPLEAGQTGAAAALFCLQALLLVQVHELAPNGYAGFAFAWVAGLPVAAYFVAELALLGSGGQSWAELQGAPGSGISAVKAWVHGALELSPLTALWALLERGGLGGGVAPDWGMGAGLALVNGALGALRWRRRT